MSDDKSTGGIGVICSKCGARLLMPADSAGKQITCSKCWALVDVPAITVVRVVAPAAAPGTKPAPAAPTAPAAPAAKPAPAAKAPVPKKPAASRPAKPAAAKPAAPQSAPASSAPVLRTQATKISEDTLAKFGKLAPKPNGTPRSAAESWPEPDQPVRVWGQIRSTGTASGNDAAAAQLAARNSLMGRTVTAINRVPRKLLLPLALLAGVLVVGLVGVIGYSALTGSSGGSGAGTDWELLEYTSSATPRNKDADGNPGDTVVRVRVRFDPGFTGPRSLTGDDWELRDETTPGRSFYNINFTLNDPANRTGTLGFIVSGAWRPRDVSLRVKREEAWLSLGAARSKD
jgi:hypothetical protein